MSPSQIAVTSSPMMSGPQFTRLQSTNLPNFGTMLESFHNLKFLPSTVHEIWSGS